MGTFALAALAWGSAANAQSTCNGSVDLSATGNFFAEVGDEYVVDLTFGAGSIGNGSTLNVRRIRFNLDCTALTASSINCTSATTKISYQNVLSVNAGCPAQVWTADHLDDTVTPNQVIFTPSAPFNIAENTTPCTLSFHIQVEEFDEAGDVTPNAIEASAGFDGNQLDAVCDNGLATTVAQPGSLQTCPVCDDGLACNGVETCDQGEFGGDCIPGTPIECLSDGATCTTEACSEEANQGAGGCVTTPDNTVCEDEDECTDNICDPEDANADPETGCTFPEDTTEPPESCEEVSEFVCRTCGFWGNHPDIVQDLLDDAGDIQVCGGPIMDTTEPNEETSANEAICVKVEGNQYRQLARQLTCLALNCQFTGGPPLDDALTLDTRGIVVDNICTGQTAGGVDLGALFEQCDTACETDSAAVGNCIERVDCVNNGGTPVQQNGSWTCAGGECAVSGDLCGFDEGACAANTCVEGTCSVSDDECSTNEDCTPNRCDLFEAQNCHQQDLCPEGEDTYCYEPPGAAKTGDCKGSKKTECTYADLDCPDPVEN